MTAKVLPLRGSAPTPSSWSDEAVAHACSVGDPAAIAELFDRFEAPVTRYLSRLVHAREECEDLVQATFLEIARGKARFSAHSSAKTWLFGIATNVLRHHLRSLARRRRLARAFHVVGIGTSAITPSSQAEARTELARARAVLATLPERQRLAFVMCELEGLSARAAAEALGTSEAAVWRRVSDARRTLLATLRGGS